MRFVGELKALAYRDLKVFANVLESELLDPPHTADVSIADSLISTALRINPDALPNNAVPSSPIPPHDSILAYPAVAKAIAYPCAGNIPTYYDRDGIDARPRNSIIS
jgi:hypothetical protein